MDANSSNSVLNLVVRDVWIRSRLTTDDLAEIWDLVVNIQGSDRLLRSVHCRNVADRPAIEGERATSYRHRVLVE